MQIWLFITGLFAGIIDAIAGGGGLITLPVWSYFLGPGNVSVATNKIVGTIASLVALLVYLRSSKINLKSGSLFLISIIIGSYGGSLASKIMSKDIFYFMLLSACPLMIFIISKRDILIQKSIEHKTKSRRWFILAGAFCGFYDGFFGPGGGTFMLLSLVYLTPLNLLESLALSKLANTLSAGTALLSYSYQGLVHWDVGLIMGAGIGLGAFIGASFARQNAQKIVRPVLYFVISLIFIKVLGMIL
jgi:uncharacterized membrane protein YfcA